jgi:hypothetical protein
VTIVVNGDRCHLSEGRLTYEKAVELADSGRSKQALHSVTFRRGGDPAKPEGILAPGESTPACEGMVVCAMVTDNA